MVRMGKREEVEVDKVTDFGVEKRGRWACGRLRLGGYGAVGGTTGGVYFRRK